MKYMQFAGQKKSAAQWKKPDSLNMSDRLQAGTRLSVKQMEPLHDS